MRDKIISGFLWVLIWWAIVFSYGFIFSNNTENEMWFPWKIEREERSEMFQARWWNTDRMKNFSGSIQENKDGNWEKKWEENTEIIETEESNIIWK